jgi:sec-independent protein translocase protein TatC
MAEKIVEEIEEEEVEEAQEKKMGFLDHMEELRQRILRSLFALVVASSLSGALWKPLWELLRKPAGEDINFLAISVLEPFMFKVKLAIFAGALVAAPFIIYQLVAFVAPALKAHEKRWVYPFVAFLVILFYSGVVFGYLFVMPPATKWLLAQGMGTMLVQPRVDYYLGYAAILTLGMGACFETPLFIVLLSKLGIVDSKSLLSNWRIATIIILVIAAILTPDWSPVTMAIFAAPMIVLYFLSILLVKFF